MSESKRIKTALVSVYHKEGLDEIITKLHEEGVEFLSTGGTRQFIESLGYPCKAVEDLTSYPSILGGRVKTLHPKIFGGILCRRGLEQDIQQIEKYEIPEIDLVIVDLYPFVAAGFLVLSNTPFLNFHVAILPQSWPLSSLISPSKIDPVIINCNLSSIPMSNPLPNQPC